MKGNDRHVCIVELESKQVCQLSTRRTFTLYLPAEEELQDLTYPIPYLRC